jgi:hypothetical protein
MGRIQQGVKDVLLIANQTEDLSQAIARRRATEPPTTAGGAVAG